MPDIKVEGETDPGNSPATDAEGIREVRRTVLDAWDILQGAVQTRGAELGSSLLDDEAYAAQFRKLETAVASLEQIVQSNANSTTADRARLLLGIAQSALGNYFHFAANENAVHEHCRAARDWFAGLPPAMVSANSLAAQCYIDVLDRLIASEPGSRELRFERCDLLRRVGRQQKAFEDIDELSANCASHSEFIRLKCALLCDIGDFGLAFNVVEPLTTPIDAPSATNALLNLRGWADQNLPEDRYKLDGEEVYRRALQIREDDLWARKGLANSLRRLGREEEAREQYEAVIKGIEELKKRDEANAYRICLCGWCYYCIGRFNEAAQCYAVGLSTAELGAAYHFDYGLILLSDAYPSTAVSQYNKGIESLKSKDPLRQCGLLYVALFDVLTAMQFKERLANASETLDIRALLRETLLQAVAKLESWWNEFGDRMRRFARWDEEEASTHQTGWSRYTVAGLEMPAAQLPWAVLAPIVRLKGNQSAFYRLPANPVAPESSLEPVPADTIVELPKAKDVSSDSKVLWVSAMLVEAIGVENLSSGGAVVEWQRLSDPVDSRAAVVQADVASDLLNSWATPLNSWATSLISESLSQLTHHFRTGEQQDLSEARRLAELAVRVASDQMTRYHAIIAFGAAEGELDTEFIEEACSRLQDYTCADSASLDEAIERFRSIAMLAGERQGETKSSTSKTIPDVFSSSDPMISRILERAYSIAQVEDPEERDRQALEAAEEMKLLIPLEGSLKEHRDLLLDKLESRADFLLEKDDSLILPLSHKPEFYMKHVLIPFSCRAGISSIAFESARERLQARKTN
jgi:tetratricopeptide (TPR) repeat protein